MIDLNELAQDVLARLNPRLVDDYKKQAALGKVDAKLEALLVEHYNRMLDKLYPLPKQDAVKEQESVSMPSSAEAVSVAPQQEESTVAEELQIAPVVEPVSVTVYEPIEEPAPQPVVQVEPVVQQTDQTTSEVESFSLADLNPNEMPEQETNTPAVVGFADSSSDDTYASPIVEQVQQPTEEVVYAHDAVETVPLQAEEVVSKPLPQPEERIEPVKQEQTYVVDNLYMQDESYTKQDLDEAIANMFEQYRLFMQDTVPREVYDAAVAKYEHINSKVAKRGRGFDHSESQAQSSAREEKVVQEKQEEKASSLNLDWDKEVGAIVTEDNLQQTRQRWEKAEEDFKRGRINKKEFESIAAECEKLLTAQTQNALAEGRSPGELKQFNEPRYND